MQGRASAGSVRRGALLLGLLLLAPVAAAETVVRLVDGRFEPAEAGAATWEWIVWTWDDGEMHGIAPVDGGEAWCEPGPGPCRWSFMEPGEYRYHDPLHPEIAGVVVVTREAGEPGAPLRPYFVYWREGVDLRFDASPTAEARTAVESYTWDFGDGATGSGRIVEHTYPAAGAYQVKLTVVDEFGRTTEYTRTVFAAAAVDPSTRFNATGNGRSVQFESRPWEGAHTWDFGDGERAVCDPTCVAPPGTLASSPTSLLHVYRRGGTFNVTHEVRDENGTRNVTAPVTVDAQESFSLSADGLTVEVDAGLLPTYGNATFAWLFGDLARATGARANHTFSRDGVWSVALTIADEAGLQTMEREIALMRAEGAPAPQPTPLPSVAPVSGIGLLVIALVLATAAALKSERYK